MELYKLISRSSEETKKIASEFAKSVKLGDIVILRGDLGSGKTTFSKGFCSYFKIDEDLVSSPSFTILNIYASSVLIYHLDMYRINSLDEIDYETFLEYLQDEKAIKLIEWNKYKIDENFSSFGVFVVEISFIDENQREIRIVRAN